MFFDLLLHFLIGLAGASAGWGVRSLCQHKGLLPHPRMQVPIILVLIMVEAYFSVLLVG
jgi:F0F1-type ATP synthase membrane subunit c/vacuolar-type H+-ATPase subunit K